MTATRREAILAHLARHPDLTAHELVRVIGAASGITGLLRDMEAKGQVVSRLERRVGHTRPVRLWRVAPPGTVPPPVPPVPAAVLNHRRERDRITTAARRARSRDTCLGPPPLPAAACRTADPDLFFPETAAAEAEAVAICAGCPVRVACYARAVQSGERYGIWGGVNLEREPRPRAAAVGGSQPDKRRPLES